MSPHPAFTDGPLAPLPGTDRPRRALFLDRWGTLLEAPTGDPRRTYAKLEFTPGAVDALFRATQAGWAIYLLGNEPAVALGHVKDARWREFEADLLGRLSAQGVQIRRSYACLDDPVHGKGSHCKDSVFLLPNTGAMYHARQHDGIDLQQSWVIGDSTLELAAGWRAGCRTAGVLTGEAMEDGELEIDVAFRGATLADVLNEIQSLAEAANA